MLPPREVTPALGELLELVDAERDEFLSLGEFDAKTLEALRKAFLPNMIADTLNIEGIQANPRITLAVMDGKVLAESDKYVEREVRNVVDAHALVRNLAVALTGLDLELLRRVNFEIEKELVPNAGQLRQKDVEITGAQVRPPGFALLERRAEELCQTFEAYSDQTHPIVLAAWLHREFAELHPFEDGNGRTARLLQDLVLLTHKYLPVGIPAIRRQEYYDALSQGDFGDLEPLIAMIANSELTALTKARQVVRDPGVRSMAIGRLLAGRQEKVTHTREREFEVWRRRVDELLDEAKIWASELNDRADGRKLMRLKLWDPLPYESWLEIRERGFARNSWVSTFFFSEPPAAGFSILLLAKRLDKMAPLQSLVDRSDVVGVQLLVNTVGAKYDLHATGGDPYVRLRAIGISAAGFEAYTDDGGQISATRLTVTEAIEQLVSQAAVKAGWAE